jgi:hypothetical protein
MILILCMHMIGLEIIFVYKLVQVLYLSKLLLEYCAKNPHYKRT